MRCLVSSLGMAVLVLASSAYAWDSDDLEVFDVVDEVGTNFYTLLDIQQDATSQEIKKAFRRLSLQLHPDKNDAPDAQVKFRQLVSVYDILKDTGKRLKYNLVLENGLPDWKQAIYYYRRVRKMGLVEMSIILFIIVTIGQYLVAWAAYFEKKYAIEEFISVRSKKLQKKQKKGKLDINVPITPELVTSSVLPKPTVACTLPVQICKLAWFLVFGLPPFLVHTVRTYYQERQRWKEQQAVIEESEEEVEVLPRERGPRRRKERFTVPELSGEDAPPPATPRESALREEEPKVICGGLWTDDDFADLFKLTKKFPPGTHERWEKIGESMRRPATEVAHMAHKIKDDGFKPIIKQAEEEPEAVDLKARKVKTRGGKATEGEGGEESCWSQVQQKAFEAAIAKFREERPSDRVDWERIAKSVPSKTKEECILRYKYLSDIIKKKKEKESSNCANGITVAESEAC